MAITCVMASFSGLRVSSRPSLGGFSSAVSGTRLTGTSRYLCPQSAYYMDSSMHPRHSSQMGRIPPNPGIVAACAVPVSSPGATPLPFFFVSSYLRTFVPCMFGPRNLSLSIVSCAYRSCPAPVSDRGVLQDDHPGQAELAQEGEDRRAEPHVQQVQEV